MFQIQITFIICSLFYVMVELIHIQTIFFYKVSRFCTDDPVIIIITRRQDFSLLRKAPQRLDVTYARHVSFSFVMEIFR